MVVLCVRITEQCKVPAIKAGGDTGTHEVLCKVRLLALVECRLLIFLLEVLIEVLVVGGKAVLVVPSLRERLALLVEESATVEGRQTMV